MEKTQSEEGALACVFVCIASGISAGQCVKFEEVLELNCSHAWRQDTYPMTFIVSGDISAQKTVYNCWGLNEVYYSSDGVWCGVAKLSDSERRSLVELARNEEILVPSCRGQYVPFDPLAFAEINKRMTFAR